MESPVCRMAMVCDPDGNKIMHPQAEREATQFPMSILVKPNTKVLVQGITGSFGAQARATLD